MVTTSAHAQLLNVAAAHTYSSSCWLVVAFLLPTIPTTDQSHVSNILVHTTDASTQKINFFFPSLLFLVFVSPPQGMTGVGSSSHAFTAAPPQSRMVWAWLCRDHTYQPNLPGTCTSRGGHHLFQVPLSQLILFREGRY